MLSPLLSVWERLRRCQNRMQQPQKGLTIRDLTNYHKFDIVLRNVFG